MGHAYPLCLWIYAALCLALFPSLFASFLGVSTHSSHLQTSFSWHPYQVSSSRIWVPHFYSPCLHSSSHSWDCRIMWVFFSLCLFPFTFSSPLLFFSLCSLMSKYHHSLPLLYLSPNYLFWLVYIFLISLNTSWRWWMYHVYVHHYILRGFWEYSGLIERHFFQVHSGQIHPLLESSQY
jgi:hypothetical protein